MNGNQLKQLETSVWTAFMMYESRMYDLQKSENGGEWADAAIRFIDIYFLYEEVKALRKSYFNIRTALSDYLKDEPFCDPIVETDRKLTIWEVCQMNLCGEGSRFWLTSQTETLKHFAGTQYEREKAARQLFDKFFGQTPKSLLVNDESGPVSPEVEAKVNLSKDLSNMELSFSVDAFGERMREASLLCYQQADPAKILELFP